MKALSLGAVMANINILIDSFLALAVREYLYKTPESGIRV